MAIYLQSASPTPPQRTNSRSCREREREWQCRLASIVFMLLLGNGFSLCVCQTPASPRQKKNTHKLLVKWGQVLRSHRLRAWIREKLRITTANTYTHIQFIHYRNNAPYHQRIKYISLLWWMCNLKIYENLLVSLFGKFFSYIFVVACMFRLASLGCCFWLGISRAPCLRKKK